MDACGKTCGKGCGKLIESLSGLVILASRLSALRVFVKGVVHKSTQTHKKVSATS